MEAQKAVETMKTILDAIEATMETVTDMPKLAFLENCRNAIYMGMEAISERNRPRD